MVGRVAASAIASASRSSFFWVLTAEHSRRRPAEGLGQGALASAVAVLAFGLLCSPVADHVVRPVLIGGATKLPFLWVLLGILGGVETGVCSVCRRPCDQRALCCCGANSLTGKEAPASEGQARVCVIKQRAAQCRFPSRSSWVASSKRGE